MEQNIWNVNILLTCADDRNDDETSTFMDGGRGNAINRGQGPDLTACLVGLRSHSRSHWGHCLTRMGPKYVGSSKYFPCVRACMRACVRPPTDKCTVYIVCKTLYLWGILVVFCSYLEYNAITPFCSHVLYRFLHTYFFSCTEVLSMLDLRFVLSPYVCM